MSLHRYTFAIIAGTTSLAILFVIFACIYLYVYRSHNRRKTQEVIADKHLLYVSPGSITSDRFVFPLTKLPSMEPSLHQMPSNYKTFDLARHSQEYHSSDSSYQSSTDRHSQGQSFSFGTVKSKFQQAHCTLPRNSFQSRENIHAEHLSTITSDSDNTDTQSLAPIIPSFEYSLMELFRIELVYRLYISTDDDNANELIFQIVRLTPMQTMIEQCFSSFLCKIRLFTSHDKYKSKQYRSRKDPVNEVFKFDMNRLDLEKSYLKLHLLGQQKNDQPVELGQTVFVVNQMTQIGHSTNQATHEQYTKSIQIYEDRIDMIIRKQIFILTIQSENETRALICLVYENDRCLLHVGLIKILAIQYLLKQPPSHFHYRDQIQIKICTIIDGKIIGKRKSKLMSIIKGVCTFSTSFHFDYVSLHKTSIRITICYRRSFISSYGKSIAIIEFGSTQLKDQQSFQHWTDTLSTPNRPHIHWHTLKPINTNSEN